MKTTNDTVEIIFAGNGWIIIRDNTFIKQWTIGSNLTDAETAIKFKEVKEEIIQYMEDTKLTPSERCKLNYIEGYWNK